MGIAVDSQLQRILDACERGLRQYFTDSRFLQVVDLKGNRYIGKTLHEGFPSFQIDDVVRNIQSILIKLDPTRRLREKDIRLYSLEAEESEQGAIAKD